MTDEPQINEAATWNAVPPEQQLDNQQQEAAQGPELNSAAEPTPTKDTSAQNSPPAAENPVTDTASASATNAPAQTIFDSLGLSVQSTQSRISVAEMTAKLEKFEFTKMAQSTPTYLAFLWKEPSKYRLPKGKSECSLFLKLDPSHPPIAIFSDLVWEDDKSHKRYLVVLPFWHDGDNRPFMVASNIYDGKFSIHPLSAVRTQPRTPTTTEEEKALENVKSHERVQHYLDSLEVVHKCKLKTEAPTLMTDEEPIGKRVHHIRKRKQHIVDQSFQDDDDEPTPQPSKRKKRSPSSTPGGTPFALVEAVHRLLVEEQRFISALSNITHTL